MTEDPNELIKSLIDNWCDRRELAALANLLPCWLANDGLTDGWCNLRSAPKHTHSVDRDLPDEERDRLKQAVDVVDGMLARRG